MGWPNEGGFAGFVVPAANFYVRPWDGIDDAGRSGSTSQPFKTLAYAMTRAISGQTVYGYAGSHLITGALTIPVGVNLLGCSDPTVGTTDIDVGYTPDGNQLNAGILLRTDTEGTDGNQSVKWINMDGNRQLNYGLYVRGRSNVEVAYCKFRRTNTWGVTFSGQITEVDGTGPTILATGNSIHHCVIDDCSTYSETGGSSIGYGCLQFGGQEGFQAYENTITQTTRPSGQNGYAVKHYRNGYNKNCRIFNSTINRNHTGCTFPFTGEIWNSYGLEIDHNNFDGGWDLICNKGGFGDVAYGVDYHHNVIVNTTAGLGEYEMAVEFEDQAIGACADCIVRNNIAIGTSTTTFFSFLKVFSTGSLGNVKNFDRNKFFNNIIIGTRFMGDWGSSYTTFDDWVIENNTCDGKSIALDCLQFVGGTGTVFNNLTNRNNIIVNYTRSCIRTGDFAGGDLTNYVEDKNLMFGNGSNTRTDVVPAKIISISGTNLTSANPLFVNSAINDYHLQAGSPAKDTGAATGYTTDYYDSVRSGSMDVGAVNAP
jgi:hypothetical protein